MKLKHNVPASAFQADPVTPEYQVEVDRATERLTVAYERAQRRLAAAEERLSRAQRAAETAQHKKNAQSRAREAAVALELVELRREELQQIEALMKAAPASAEHRGTRSFRPVPRPGSQV